MKRKNWTATVLFAAVLLFAAGMPAVGQVQTGTVTISVGAVLSLDVTARTVTFPTVTQAHYEQGWATASANSLVTTRGNITHSVSMQATSAIMGATGSGARADKPGSDLQVRLRPAGGAWGSPIGLTTGAVSVVSGRAAGNHSADRPEIEYRVLLNWTADRPGTYTLGFTYTIVAN
jgi:hypothetical protein